MNNDHLESNHSFDETYKEKEEMFGHPYEELQHYFNNYPLKGSVLDLGSGQGRDSLFLASSGYEVTAIDNSKIGIKQMLKKADEQEIKLVGIVADVLNFKAEDKFDVILFDMLLHSFEKQQQETLLRKYSNFLNKSGIICIIFPDDLKIDHFMSMIRSLPGDWKLLDEIIINDVPKIEEDDSDYTFVMMVVQSKS
jgi:SAM-dependent methyltransferase